MGTQVYIRCKGEEHLNVQVLNEYDEEVLNMTVRSDVFILNDSLDESEFKFINQLINRYCSQPNGKFRVAINSETLPNDPNTPEGRKLMLKRCGHPEPEKPIK